MDFQFAVFHMVQTAQDYRAHFRSLWEDALPCESLHQQNQLIQLGK